MKKRGLESRLSTYLSDEGIKWESYIATKYLYENSVDKIKLISEIVT